MHVFCFIFCCSLFFLPLISVIWKWYYYRWKREKAIESFSVPHLLLHPFIWSSSRTCATRTCCLSFGKGANTTCCWCCKIRFESLLKFFVVMVEFHSISFHGVSLLLLTHNILIPLIAVLLTDVDLSKSSPKRAPFSSTHLST